MPNPKPDWLNAHSKIEWGQPTRFWKIIGPWVWIAVGESLMLQLLPIGQKPRKSMLKSHRIFRNLSPRWLKPKPAYVDGLGTYYTWPRISKNVCLTSLVASSRLFCTPEIGFSDRLSGFELLSVGCRCDGELSHLGPYVQTHMATS